jgi:hypothetical protein
MVGPHHAAIRHSKNSWGAPRTGSCTRASCRCLLAVGIEQSALARANPHMASNSAMRPSTTRLRASSFGSSDQIPRSDVPPRTMALTAMNPWLLGQIGLPRGFVPGFLAHLGP